MSIYFNSCLSFKVIKTKPETTCKRMPRQFCRNENCEDTHKTSTANILDEELCYYRIQMVRKRKLINMFAVDIKISLSVLRYLNGMYYILNYHIH